MQQRNCRPTVEVGSWFLLFRWRGPSIRFGQTRTMNYQFSVNVINYRRTTAERPRGFSPEMIASRSSYRDRSLIKPPTNQSILDTSTEAWHVKRKTCAIILLRILCMHFIIRPPKISFSLWRIFSKFIIRNIDLQGFCFSASEWWFLLLFLAAERKYKVKMISSHSGSEKSRIFEKIFANLNNFQFVFFYFTEKYIKYLRIHVLRNRNLVNQ